MVFNGGIWFLGGDRIDMLIERSKIRKGAAAALGSLHRSSCWRGLSEAIRSGAFQPNERN